MTNTYDILWHKKYSITFVQSKRRVGDGNVGSGVARVRCVWAEVHEETAPIEGTTRTTSSANEFCRLPRRNVAI